MDSMDIAGIKVLSQNLRSIRTGFPKLSFFLCHNKYDIICGQECWKVIGNYEINGYHTPIVAQRSLSRGGVMIWIRHEIEYEHRTDIDIFDEGNYESVAVEIKTKGKVNNLLLISFYRPPLGNIKSMMRAMEIQVTRQNKEILTLCSLEMQMLICYQIAHSHSL